MPAQITAAQVLIVEDDPEASRVMGEVVRASGLTAQVCGSAEAGWDAFAADLPYLVVVEWHLPEAGCLALCRRIKASPDGPYRTILVVANHDPQHIRPEEALKAGASFCMNQTVSHPTFGGWLEIARRGMDGLIAGESAVAKLEQYRREMEDVNAQLEESIERANQMAMEAERAYIEINQIFKTVAGGIALINNDCEVLRHNETFRLMAGVSASEAKSRKCHQVFHSSLCDTPDCPLTKIKNGAKRVESQIEKSGPGGETIYYHIVSTPFRGLAGELLGMVEHISDITTRVLVENALKESEARYKELSIVDELTGLFNKRHFNEILRYESDRTRRYKHPPLSLVIMDIDNFKHYNDTYGHAEGDKVLAAIGQIITQSIRNVDSGNRYGGEEFTVILPATPGRDATVVAERIRTNFEAYDFYPRPGEKVNKTISLGVTEFRPDDTLESLIKRADANLYRAKSSGKNCYFLD